MTHPITADHLVHAASNAVTEELFCEFNRALQSFCNEEQDRIVIFLTLRCTRIRLHVLQKWMNRKAHLLVFYQPPKMYICQLGTAGKLSFNKIISQQRIKRKI